MRDRSRWTLLLGVAAAAVLLAAATPSELVELKSTLEESFTLLPLSDGVLLQPLDPDGGPRAIEVSGAGVALDGVPAGSDEVRARLGEAAEAVLELAALPRSERTAVLDGTAETLAAEEAAAAAEALAAEAEIVEAGEAEPSPGVAPTPPERPRRPERPERPRRPRTHSGDTVVVARSMTVEAGETTEDIVVVGGFLKIRGMVDGDALVMGGSATVEGHVTGDVVAIGGPVRLEDGAHVEGDVSSVGSEVYQDRGARVDGEIEQVRFEGDLSFPFWTRWGEWRNAPYHDFDFSPWGWWSGLGWKLIRLLFLAALAWVALLIFRRPIDRMERRLAAEPWKTGLVGLLAVALFVPSLVLLCVFLAISIIGIPLLIVVPFGILALVVVAFLGFVAVAGRIGGWLGRRFGWELGSPFWVVLLGLTAIVSLSIVGRLLDFGIAPLRFVAGLFLFFGGLVWFTSWVFGIGAAVLTRFGTAASWSRADDLVAPLPPIPGETPPSEPPTDLDDRPPIPEPDEDE